MEPSCDCIIPFYNENGRLLDVLDNVTKVQSINTIICVDDGSTDGAGASAQTAYPSITLVTLPENHGKTNAIQEGLKHSSTPYLLLLDSDLKDVRPDELTAAIGIIRNDPTLDMLVLRRHVDLFSMRLLRQDIVASGQRILKRTDLEKIFLTHPTGYQLEVATNGYMMRYGKRTAWMPFSARNELKFKKRGIARGVRGSIAMSKEMVAYTGWRSYLHQTLFFCRNKIQKSNN
jgi:glycosyltransferase involved in cell wall biosynthesis